LRPCSFGIPPFSQGASTGFLRVDDQPNQGVGFTALPLTSTVKCV